MSRLATRCPKCHADLTEPFSVEIHERVVSYDVHVATVDPSGELDRDKEDLAREEVIDIDHVGVYCANCEYKFLEWKD